MPPRQIGTASSTTDALLYQIVQLLQQLIKVTSKNT